MIESDKAEFAEAVTEVLKSYRQEVGKIILRIWWTALEKHDLNTVLNALGSYCAHPDKCKFAPKAGDIVGMIEGTAEDRKAVAQAAWSRLMQNCDGSATVVFDDEAMHYAISVAFNGNWRNVGMDVIGSFEEQEHKRTFERAYASYKDGMNYPAKLIGHYEIDNHKNGYEYDEVRYIGDKQKCLAVESKPASLDMAKADAIGIVQIMKSIDEVEL